MMKRISVAAAVLVVGVLFIAPSAEAAIFRGIQEVIAGVFQLPLSTIAGTFNGPPVVGTVFGAVNGLISGVGLVAHGALELADSALGVAKTVGPYLIPIFL